MRFCLLALLLCGCGGTSAHRKPEVRIVVTSGSYVQLPVHLAQTLGYFEQEGVPVSLANLPGSSKVMEALMGRSADVAATLTEHILQLAAEGQSMKAFVHEFSGPASYLVVSPATDRKIVRIEDLRGGSLGVSAVGSQTHMIGNYLLSRHGVPAAEITAISIGFGGPNVAALEQGRVDAGFVSPSGLILLKRRHPDLRVLFDPYSEKEVAEHFGLPRYPSGVLCARSEWLAQQPEAARKVARAVVRALRFLQEKSVEEVAGLLPAGIKTEDNSVDAAALAILRPYYSRDGVFPGEGYDTLLRVVAASVDKVRTAAIDPREVYTNDFVRGAK